MARLIFLFTLVLIGAVALPLGQPPIPQQTPAAQTPPAGRGRGGVPVQGAEPDIPLDDRFDKDGNKRLDYVERTAAREYLTAHPELRRAVRSRQMKASLAALALVLSTPLVAAAQAVPEPYQTVLTTLGKTGDFKDGVLKVNIPRGDVTVTLAGRPAPTPFGFGGWVAFTKGDHDMDVMMGDLVLTEDEVNPVMSAILTNGLQVTALHNHFFWDQPRMFYMHVHGYGTAAAIAKQLKPAVDLINGFAAKRPKPVATAAPAPATPALDTAALAKIIGAAGDQNGAVYKITIGRPDIEMREHGALVNSRMGLNTWAAFTGTDADAMVAGDVAMLEHEVTPVLAVLRANGLDIVAIHHHMTDTRPVVIFLHYFGTGQATQLAKGVRDAVDLLGKGAPGR